MGRRDGSSTTTRPRLPACVEAGGDVDTTAAIPSSARPDTNGWSAGGPA
jgi:hypothetical protein